MFSTNIQAKSQKLFVPKGKKIIVAMPPDDTPTTFVYSPEPYVIPAAAKALTMEDDTPEEPLGSES